MSIPPYRNPMSVSSMLSSSSSTAPPLPLLPPIPIPSAIISIPSRALAPVTSIPPVQAHKPEFGGVGGFNRNGNNGSNYPSLPTAFARESPYQSHPSGPTIAPPIPPPSTNLPNSLNNGNNLSARVPVSAQQISNNLQQFSALPNQINLQSRVRWEEVEKLRKRSAGEMNLKRAQEQVPKRIDTYTLQEINNVELGKSSLIKIDSEEVTNYLTLNKTNSNHEILFTSTYNPLLTPVSQLSSTILSRNIGKYFYTTFNLDSLIGPTREYHIQAPSTPFLLQQKLSLSSQLFDLPFLSNRSIWGTDIYTDDSDLLAILFHSTWCRVSIPSTSTPIIRKESEKSIRVKFMVGPSLLRYQGTYRQGIQSRNWGNGHDGVSLLIDKVEFVPSPNKPRMMTNNTTGPSYTKKLAGEFVLSTPLSLTNSDLYHDYSDDDLTAGEEIVKEAGEEGEQEFKRRCLNSSFTFGKDGGKLISA